MRYFCLVLVMAIMLGCAPKTDFPEIETGINLADLYIEIHEQYLFTYSVVDSETQSFMRQNIAPRMNDAKRYIIMYNSAVAASEDPEMSRVEITRILRQIAFELTKIEGE